MDVFIHDMERIDRGEITDFNDEEIKNINNKIYNIKNKNDSISSRYAELNRRIDVVNKTHRLGNLVDWTDHNKTIEECEAFWNEEELKLNDNVDKLNTLNL
ncbi:hypothetical protein [Candidatus Azobacteroides pseudotrichonymphae]|uniref:Uncharacterized protein n=1 Tax=Azobacteroides pseudotrichonymphae genomovar. CFP2 TaxID=511995 RepID=B6YRX1_AZOPC|nr:hypothetical protein [Candidatus Azobacteroides pseudotrichonymphae]BAG83943.1 hypothetical protein CFPG_680 [Candidatus Azobacteroides pseudotrichonymphae genomovar. CFP2]